MLLRRAARAGRAVQVHDVSRGERLELQVVKHGGGVSLSSEGGWRLEPRAVAAGRFLCGCASSSIKNNNNNNKNNDLMDSNEINGDVLFPSEKLLACFPAD